MLYTALQVADTGGASSSGDKSSGPVRHLRQALVLRPWDAVSLQRENQVLRPNVELLAGVPAAGEAGEDVSGVQSGVGPLERSVHSLGSSASRP